MTVKTGTFYGVGVGPGDPELLTLKALRVLKGAQTIAVPKSGPGEESRALSIIKDAVDLGGKDVIDLVFPMTKDPEELEAGRRLAAGRIAASLGRGDAAFITLGDPLLYSTFSYLIPYVKELVPGLEVRSVPGITSFGAAASGCVIPLAESDEKVIIIPAAYGLEEIRSALKDFDTIVLMKINRNIEKIIEAIEGAGLIDRAWFVSKATWPDQEITTDIKGLRGRKLDYFSMLIIKKGGANG